MFFYADFSVRNINNLSFIIFCNATEAEKDEFNLSILIKTPQLLSSD